MPADPANLQHFREEIGDLLQELAKATGADAVTAFLHDRATNKFFLPVASGLRDPQTFEHFLPRADRLVARIIKDCCVVHADKVDGHLLSVPVVLRCVCRS